MNLAKASALVTTTARSDSALAIAQITGVTSIAVDTVLPSALDRKPRHFQLDRNQTMDAGKGAALIFTFGTTAPAKGVLHTRTSLYRDAKHIKDCYCLSLLDTSLHSAPTH